jgi:hypothetical protein
MQQTGAAADLALELKRCVAATPSEQKEVSGVSKTYAPTYGSLTEAKASPFLRERTRRERERAEEAVSKRYRRLVAIRRRAS